MSGYVISISREFGSGGRRIGARAAKLLGIPCYDRDLIQKTAEKSGLSPAFIARAEARAKRLLPLGVQLRGPAELQAFFAQSEVILELADQGPCVIVGRCSDYVLGDRPGCLKIFIHAPLADRVSRCAEEYHLSAPNIMDRVREIDRGRASYYSRHTGRPWGELRRYDLALNSSATGIDGAAELIASLARMKLARQTSDREL